MEEAYLDELLPNDGEAFYVQNVEAKREEAKEKAIIEQAAPVLDIIDEWFDSYIKQIESIDAIDLSKDVAVQVQGHQLARDFLVNARTNLQLLRETHLGKN